MSAALGAEWLKLRTIRSTVWALLAFASVSVLFSALSCWESETMGGGPGRPGDNDIVFDSLVRTMDATMSAGFPDLSLEGAIPGS